MWPSDLHSQDRPFQRQTFGYKNGRAASTSDAIIIELPNTRAWQVHASHLIALGPKSSVGSRDARLEKDPALEAQSALGA